MSNGQAGHALAKDGDEVAALRDQVDDLRRRVRLLEMTNAELERVALRDTLTPLYNRRHFINALNERICRLSRYGAQAAIVFADMDGLKAINDIHGHAAGDFALNHMAQLLAASIRASDVAARIGGDEFGLILEESDEAAAHAKAAQLTAVLAAVPCDFGDARIPVSASLGVAVLRPGDRDEDVMNRADAAMYAARAARRA